jgi:hypothetical protein
VELTCLLSRLASADLRIACSSGVFKGRPLYDKERVSGIDPWEELSRAMSTVDCSASTVGNVEVICKRSDDCIVRLVRPVADM